MACPLPALVFLRSHVCSAVIWPTCLSECPAFRRSPSRMVQSGLCLVGLRDVTSLLMSRLLGKCAKDSSLFSSSFHPLGLHAVALCPGFPRGGSAVSGSPLSGEHSPVSCRAPLFANGAPALRDAPFCFAGPHLVPRQLGFPSFLQPVLLDVRPL